jgi:hypothetical protein
MVLRKCHGDKLKWTEGKFIPTAVSEMHARYNPSKQKKEIHQILVCRL